MQPALSNNNPSHPATNLGNQTLADAAAVLRMNPSLPINSMDYMVARNFPLQYYTMPYQPSFYQTDAMSALPSSLTTTPQNLYQRPQTVLTNQQGQPTALPPQLTLPTFTPSPAIATAQQPPSKLLGNQQVLLPPTQTSASVSLVDANPRPAGALQTLKDVSSALGQQALSAGANMAGQAMVQAANKGYEAVLPSLVNAGGKFGTWAGNKFSGLLGKIIGDAPPDILNYTMSPKYPMGTPTPVRPEARLGAELFMSQFTSKGNKIVGDAPPDEGVMTAEQTEAAIANITSSAAYLLQAELIIEEQMLDTANGTPRGLDPVALNRQLIFMKVPSNATFKQELETLVTGIRGCPYTANWPAWHVDKTVDPPAQGPGAMTGIMCIPTWTFVAPPKQAPPVGGNTTMEQLTPLLYAAPLSDYSSQLRTRTAQTNVDNMMRLVGIASNNILAGTGYSFALPLIKILGYVLDMYQIIGEGSNNFSSGLNLSYINSYTGAKAWEDDWPRYPGETIHNETLSFAVITETSFADLMSGANGQGGAFGPTTWGVSTAVVFIPASDTDNPALNSMRVLSRLAYPVLQTADPNARAYWVNRDGNFEASATEHTTVTRVNQTYIPGPRKYVLIVITSSNTTAPMSVNFLNADNSVVTATTANSPAEPLEFNEAQTINFLTISASLHSLPFMVSWINWWETIFGNSSDRSTAMRFWAENSRYYFPQKAVTNAVTPNEPQGLGGWVPIQVNPPENRTTDWVTADTPDWIGSDFLTSFLFGGVTADGLGTMATSATGLHYQATTFNTRTMVRAASIYDACQLVPATDPIVDYLTVRRWVYPTEEYPLTKLTDLGRTSLTIAVMSNLLCGLTDLLAQTNNVSHKHFWLPVESASSQIVRKMLESNFYVSVEEILNAGIQYPTVQVNRNHNTSMLLANAACYVEMFGLAMMSGQVVAGVARIPRHDLSQYSPALGIIYNTVRLNYPQLKLAKSVVQIGGLLVPMFRILINEDDVQLAPADRLTLFNQLARLSQGFAVTTGASPNPGVFLRGETSALLVTMAANILNYDSSRAMMFQGQEGRSDINVPAFTGLCQPIGEIPLTRDPERGFEPLRLLMAGPIDMFTMDSGTYNYEMLFTMARGSMTVTTATFATVPDAIFNNTGVTRMLTSI